MLKSDTRTCIYYSLTTDLVNPHKKEVFMHHSFDISIAEKYGVNVAIFLNNIAFWIKKNQANDKHFYDGRYWTYNSSKALTDLFPYWSEDQIDRLVKKCIELDLLILGNYNKANFDRTRWYSLTDLAVRLLNLDLPRNRGTNPAESPNETREIAEPIPDINTDIKTDKKIERGKKQKPTLTFISSDFEITDHHKLLGAQLHVDVHREKEAFLDYYQAHGKKMINWNAAFNSWIRKASTFEKRYAKKEHPVTSILRDINESLPHMSEEERQSLIDFMH